MQRGTGRIHQENGCSSEGMETWRRRNVRSPRRIDREGRGKKNIEMGNVTRDVVKLPISKTPNKGDR
jgi:hypothetical protein